MKHPKPQPSTDAPAGTVWFGGPIGWFNVSFHISSEDLDPTTVTEIFGVLPDYSHRKGVPLFRDDGTVKRIPKFGVWTVEITPQDTDEWDVEEAAISLMGRVPPQIEIWQKLPINTKRRLSFGLHLESGNQGFSVGPALARYASERDIHLDFDIYVEDEEAS